MFLRRGGGEGAGLVELRVALFWVAAALWLLGMAMDWPVLTPVAIALLFVALVLGMIGRRR